MNLPIFQVKLPVHGEVLKLADKPTSSKQKYELTSLGEKVIQLNLPKKRNNTNE